MATPSPVVVLGLSPTGLYAARELGAAGARLLGIDRGRTCGQYSRHFRRGDGHWQLQDTAGLLPRLLEHAAGQPVPPMLLPSSDVFIEFIIQNHAALAGHYRFGKGYTTMATDLLDKGRFHALCHRHGVATPGVWELSGPGDLERVIDEIPYPCILKPMLIHRAKDYLRGKKVLLAHSRAELTSAFADIPEEAGGWLIQEIVPGPESAITLFAGHVDGQGQVRQGFTARKLRQYPAGFGSASLVMSETCEETRAISESFLKAIGYEGICGTEFKRDPRDGRLKIIEINPRPTLWFHLSHAAGKRVAESQWRDLCGLEPLEDRPQQDGVLWRYGIKDMASRLFYRLRGRDFVFPPPDVDAAGPMRSRCWPVYDGADPMPFLVEPLVYAGKFVARLR